MRPSVNHPLTLKARDDVKGRTYHKDAVMSAALIAGMSGMEVAFVGEFEYLGT